MDQATYEATRINLGSPINSAEAGDLMKFICNDLNVRIRIEKNELSTFIPKDGEVVIDQGTVRYFGKMWNTDGSRSAFFNLKLKQAYDPPKTNSIIALDLTQVKDEPTRELWKEVQSSVEKYLQHK